METCMRQTEEDDEFVLEKLNW